MRLELHRALLAIGILLIASSPTYADGIPAKAFRPEDITNTRRSHSDFHIEVTRGMYATTGFQVFAINSHLSTVVRFDLTTAAGATTLDPSQTHQTINNPIAIAPGLSGQVLVLGGTNHCLVVHDETTLDILDVLMVDSEPKDLVVDSMNSCCYVSCAGDDTVLRIDLSGPTLSITDRYPIPSKRPVYMTLEPHPTDPTLNRVLVSASVSGNNTISTRLKPSASAPKELRIWDGTDTSIFPSGGLPDEDIFRIDPVAATVQPLASGVAAVNSALAFNPVTQALWSVGVQLHNTTPSTEQDLNGNFATNQLSIIDAASIPPLGGPPVAPTSQIDTDGSPGSYSQLRSIANPSSIVFDDGSGQAWVAAANGPVIAVFDSAGNRFGQGGDRYLVNYATTPQILGTNCRTLVRLYSLLFAYCQDSGIIVIHDLLSPSQYPIGQLVLGLDPTPEPLKRGRAVFNDAFNLSAEGRFTCGTCHVGGAADGLAWDLSEKNADEKGPMVTQTLIGIEDSAPYHWRGERTGADLLGKSRTIADFSGAFTGLLGSPAPPSDPQLLDFIEFIKSTRPHANAYQDLDRIIKDSLVTHDQNPDPVLVNIGDPTRGDILYHDSFSDLEPNSTCTTCHTGPTGSNGDYFPDPLNDQIAARDNFEPTQLNQLTLKKQPIVDVSVNFQPSSTLRAPLLGAGTHHDGDILDLFSFSRAFFTQTPATDDQTAADLTAFLDLFDSGTSPTVHHALRLHSGNSMTAPNTPEITQLKKLYYGALRGWNGVVFFGRYSVSGTMTQLSWYFDAPNAQFVSETGLTKTLADVITDTQGALADNVFIGVPPGNEYRLGVDPDNDGLDTGTELSLIPPSDPFDPDSDDDGYLDGHEVNNAGNPTDPLIAPTDMVNPTLIGGIGGLQIEFVNASVLKVQFETDEPCTWQFDLNTGNGFGLTQDSRQTFDRIHTAVVHNLVPSISNPPRVQDYSGTLTLTDLAGNTTMVNLPPNWFTTGDATSGSHLITALNFMSESRATPTTWAGDLNLSLGDRLTSFPYSAPIAPAQSIPKPPAATDPPGTPTIPAITHPGYIAVGQLQKLVNDEWIPIPAMDIAVTSSTAFVVSTFKTIKPGTNATFEVYTQLPGPWIISELTDSNGDISMRLMVNNAPTAAESIRYVPKIICEQPLDFPGYMFAADPILVGALSRTGKPSDIAAGIFLNAGSHQFFHYGLPATNPEFRKVKSSM